MLKMMQYLNHPPWPCWRNCLRNSSSIKRSNSFITMLASKIFSNTLLNTHNLCYGLTYLYDPLNYVCTWLLFKWVTHTKLRNCKDPSRCRIGSFARQKSLDGVAPPQRRGRGGESLRKRRRFGFCYGLVYFFFKYLFMFGGLVAKLL